MKLNKYVTFEFVINYKAKNDYGCPTMILDLVGLIFLNEISSFSTRLESSLHLFRQDRLIAPGKLDKCIRNMNQAHFGGRFRIQSWLGRIFCLGPI